MASYRVTRTVTYDDIPDEDPSEHTTEDVVFDSQIYDYVYYRDVNLINIILQ